jgi:hypothetical protein
MRAAGLQGCRLVPASMPCLLPAERRQGSRTVEEAVVQYHHWLTHMLLVTGAAELRAESSADTAERSNSSTAVDGVARAGERCNLQQPALT